MAENVEVSISGDYAVLKTGDLYFYYGYEHVWCLDHSKFADRCGDDCETEWAFTVKRSGQYVAKYRCSLGLEEFGVEQQLIYGLGKFIQEAKEK